MKLKLLLFSTGQIKSKLQKLTQKPQTLCKTLENKITYPLQTENIFCHVFLNVKSILCVSKLLAHKQAKLRKDVQNSTFLVIECFLTCFLVGDFLDLINKNK